MLCTKGRLSGHPWYWVSQSATLSDEGRVGWRECVCGRGIVVQGSVSGGGHCTCIDCSTPPQSAGESSLSVCATGRRRHHVIWCDVMTGGRLYCPLSRHYSTHRTPWPWLAGGAHTDDGDEHVVHAACRHAGVYVLLNQLWVCDPSPRCFDPARLLVFCTRPTEPNYRLSLRRPFSASHRMRRRHYSFIYWIRTVSSTRVQWTHNTIKWLI